MMCGTDYEAKIGELRALLDADPAAMPVRVALAEALFRSVAGAPREPLDALRRLNEAVGLDPYRPAFHYHLGLQWQRLGVPDRALTSYGRALAFSPNNVRVMHQMALAHLDAGAFDKARKQWDEAEKILKLPRPAQEAARASAQSGQRALFVLQCGRAEAALCEGSPQAAIECLERARPLKDCASLVGEMALKCLLMGCDAQRVRAWVTDSLDAEEREKTLGILLPYLRAYEEAGGEGEFPLDAPIAPPAGSLHVLRSLVAFDWARRRGITALWRLARLCPGDDALAQAALALLHAEGSRLYAAGKEAEALYLWRQALLSEPYSPGVAHNLALAATRIRSEGDYAYWWGRAQRSWRAYAFIAPRLERYRRLAAEKHLAFATKLSERVLAPSARGTPLEELRQWVDEMEQYLLCEHYEFTSAFHLLGIPQSARQEAIDEAYQAMKWKTEAFPPACFPGLGALLLQERLGKLEQAYAAIRTATARRPYRCPQHVKELPRARGLRDRRVEYLVKIGGYLEKECANLPLDAAQAYARIARCLLAHPYRALQRQFHDAGKADASTPAGEYLRRAMMPFYDRHIKALLARGMAGADARGGSHADRLLADLRALNPRHWKPLYDWAVIERQMGNVEDALALARDALANCDHYPSRRVLVQFIAETEERPDLFAVERFVTPAKAHMEKREWESAIPLLRSALGRRPRMAELHCRLARCLAGLERFSEARAAIDSAEGCPLTDEMRRLVEQTKADVDDAEIAPFHQQAEAAKALGNWDEALRHLDEAGAVNAGHALIHASRAHCLLARHIEAMRSGREPRSPDTGASPTGATGATGSGREPRSPDAVADVRAALETALACLNADRFRDGIDAVRRQLADVERQLGQEGGPP